MRNKLISKALLLYILVFGYILSCSTKEDNNEIIQVKYGTSFGECIGYCKRDLTLKSGRVTFNKLGWVDTIRTITFTEILDEHSWQFLKMELEINSFLDLPKVIGCPDCADGGAEWIEIDLANGAKHKVTFEYNNEPAVASDYIVRLRELMGKFEFWEADKKYTLLDHNNV